LLDSLLQEKINESMFAAVVFGAAFWIFTDPKHEQP